MTLFATSWLYVPATRPDRMAKAWASGAAAVILDCEDAVAPDRKPEARANVAAFLAERPRDGPLLAVRINPLERIDGMKDLLCLADGQAPADVIVVPKAEAPGPLALADTLLTNAGSPTRLMALIESARGVRALDRIAAATPRLGALMFGGADYAADLGMEVASFSADPARSAMIDAAVAAGLFAIDTPFFAVGEADALSAACAASRALGFHGKAAIHPSQIGSIEAAFAPGDSQKARAAKILESAIDGVALVEGQMVDVAMLRWARRILPEHRA